MSLKSQPSAKRLTIGVLIDSLYSNFEEKIWSSIVNTCKSKNVNLICFNSGSLRGIEYLVNGNMHIAQHLATKDLFDGLIALSGSLGNYMDEVSLKRFYDKFSPLPLVSISRPIPGMINLLIDNRQGMRELVEHMLECHGYQRIAFIRGPECNPEAEIRYQVYREVLQRAGHLDEELIVPGDFNSEAGIRAIEILLDERKVTFDALIAANDCMALTAIKELQRRGYRIPEDVAVAGFDDTEEAISHLPQLTTVSQPLLRLGEEAVITLLNTIKGDSVATEFVLPTKVVIRHSCGCSDFREIHDRIELSFCSNTSTHTSFTTMLNQELMNDFATIPDLINYKGCFADLTKALEQDIVAGNTGAFLKIFEDCITKSIISDLNIERWYSIVNKIFLLARDYWSVEQLKTGELLWMQAMILIGFKIEQSQKKAQIKHQNYYDTLFHAYHILLSSFNEEIIKKVIKTEFPKLGIDSFYLFTIEDGSDYNRANLFFHYDLSGHIILDPDVTYFDSNQLIPGKFADGEDNYAFIVQPLHVKDELLGYMVCEIDVPDGIIYDTLISQISSAFKGTRLMNEVRKYAFELEQKVKERTEQLQEAQQQLIETAHQAGMAEIAIGITHNIGNIINSISISSEEISQLINQFRLEGLSKANQMLVVNRDHLGEFFSNDPKGKILPEYYIKVVNDLIEDHGKLLKESEYLLEKVELTRDIIKTLQEYASGRLITGSDGLNLVEIIETVLRIQGSNISRNEVQIVKNYSKDEKIPIVAQKVKAIHILINIVKNAIEAMDKNPLDQRIITIDIDNSNANNIVVVIKDNGEGISEENLKKIFSFGFSSKKDGHGFGLHTCANYMKEMGGSIRVTSEGIGKGAAFVLEFLRDNQNS